MITADALALGFDPARLARVTRRVEADIAAGRCSGVALRVARHGQVVIDVCEGYADRDAGMPLEPDAVFHLMSLSKVLTATVTLKLIEDGVFHLTTPIAEVIPEFGRIDKQSINVFHLLTQTGGLPMDTPGVGPEVIANLEQYAAWTFDRPATCRAGEQVAYSVLVAHSVLGLFMQRVCGRGFNELLHDHLFAPLGMRDTAFGPRADLMARRCPLQAAPYLLAPEYQPAATIAASHIARITAYATTPQAVVPGGGVVA
jgi:CubicO group peptidase (beta-lactamase class C family)